MCDVRSSQKNEIYERPGHGGRSRQSMRVRVLKGDSPVGSATVGRLFGTQKLPPSDEGVDLVGTVLLWPLALSAVHTDVCVDFVSSSWSSRLVAPTTTPLPVVDHRSRRLQHPRIGIPATLHPFSSQFLSEVSSLSSASISASMSLLEASPRSAARARLKQKHEDEPWKKRYDLAVKQSLGLRLSTPQAGAASGKTRQHQFSPNNSRTGHGSDDQEEMDEILAPSFEAGGNCVESTSSADDSIIRRVEEEIAAARKAASGMNRKLRSPKRSSGMPIVLHLPGGVAETIGPSASSSSEDSSKHRALEMIQDEFQDEDHDAFPNKEQSFDATAPQVTPQNNGLHVEVVYSRENTPRNIDHDDAAPDQLFFTDEEWQVGDGPADDQAFAPADEATEPPPSSSPNIGQSEQNPLIERKSSQSSLDGQNTFNLRLPKKLLHLNDQQAAPDDEEMEDRQEEQPVPGSPTNKEVVTTSSTPSSPTSSKRDSPASSVTRNKEPEGVYSGLKDIISTPANLGSHMGDKTRDQPNEVVSDRTLSFSLSTVSRNSQQKTRELLDNLREQREAMASPRRSGAEATPLIPTTPRSPTMTRATRARERVKTASRVRAMPRTDETTAESPTEAAIDQPTVDTSMGPTVSSPRSPSPRIPSNRPVRSSQWSTTNQGDTPVVISTASTVDGFQQTPLNEWEEAKRAKRIRFRNPFPVIKNPNSRRDADSIAHDHSVGIQETPIRWIKPKQELKQLIVAAMGTSLPRRSNACGALKVLTQQAKNQLALVRTDGFLSALIFAASQSLTDIDRDLAIDARTRAVNCLKNVAAPKENRVLMMNHPGVLECLVKVIKTDGNEGRVLATATVAMLAKTPVCREGLALVDGLIDVISKVLHGEGEFPIEENPPLSENAQTRRKLNDDVSDFSTHSESQTEDEENQENIEENRKKQSKRDVDVANAEFSDEEEGSEDDEDDKDDEYAGTPPVEISHKKAAPQLDSIRNKLEVRHQEFVDQARANACAILLHMSRQCTISPQLCASRQVLFSLASVAREVTMPIHSKCLEIICNLSRFPHNNITITNYEGMIDLLVAASSSAPADNRLNALRTLQNLSADPLSKRYLATTQVLNLMTSCAMRKDTKEKEVAVATIYNITTEPSAVTAITNTKNVVATLVHLAHSPDSSSTIRLLACEALATISLWLQTLAGTGSIPDGVSGVPLPSQKTSGWERWD